MDRFLPHVTYITNRLIMILSVLLLLLSTPSYAAEDMHDHDEHAITATEHHTPDTHAEHQTISHDEHGEDGHDEEATLSISPQSQAIAHIQVTTLKPRPLPITLQAPGEVVFNQEKTAFIEPRIAAQAIKQFAYTGDHVKVGQPMVRLSSIEVAKAQSDLLLAAQEWHRIRDLKGKNVVTDKDYESAKLRYDHAYGLLRSYGMTETDIKQLMAEKDGQNATGEFNLITPIDGTVAETQITLGDHVEPGTTLYHIIDEQTLWVNTQVTPKERRQIHVGQPAWVRLDSTEVKGKVTQVHHTVNEATRRQTVRVEIDNPNDKLHPGDFVDVAIQVASSEPQLAVPESALVRSADGDWLLYIASDENQFEPKEVKRVKTIDRWVVITGVTPGVRFVEDGAFFVHAEAQKGQFDIHNH